MAIRMGLAFVFCLPSRSVSSKFRPDGPHKQPCISRLLAFGPILTFEVLDDVGSQAGQHPQCVNGTKQIGPPAMEPFAVHQPARRATVCCAFNCVLVATLSEVLQKLGTQVMTPRINGGRVLVTETDRLQEESPRRFLHERLPLRLFVFDVPVFAAYWQLARDRDLVAGGTELRSGLGPCHSASGSSSQRAVESLRSVIVTSCRPWDAAPGPQQAVLVLDLSRSAGARPRVRPRATSAEDARYDFTFENRNGTC